MTITETLQEQAVSAGIPGLFGLSFIDSAGLPTAAAPDIVLMILVQMRLQAPQIIALLAAATIGSTLGCVLLYYVGRRGGAVALRRFDSQRRERVRERIERYGFWAMVAAVMGPPPVPTKLFVLSAGVFGMRLRTLVVSVLLGRTVRYVSAAYLGLKLGEPALEMIRSFVPWSL